MTTEIPAWIGGTLTPVEKLEAHTRGFKHKAVSVFVIRGMDILMQRRALSKYHTAGLWANTCCTHPNWDENASDCAVRRLDEELGLTGLYPEFRHRLEYRADVGGGMVEHEVVDVFMGRARAGLEPVPNPDEVMETRWVNYHDLQAEVMRHPARFTPWLKIYLGDYADRIFGPDLVIAGRS